MNIMKRFLVCGIFLIILSSCGGVNMSITTDISENTTSESESIEDEKDYQDYSESDLDNLDNFYLKDGTYCIYLYSTTCPFCSGIKQDIFKYIDKSKLNPNLIKMFIFNIGSNSISQGTINREKFKYHEDDDAIRDSLIEEMLEGNVSSLSDTYFFGTPSLYFIRDKKLYDYKLGKDVSSFLVSNNNL